MRLKSKIAVTYNIGVNTQKSELIEGIVSTCIQQIELENSYSFSFEYKSESGDLIERGSFSMSDDEINGLYEAVKADVPSGLNYTDTTEYLYLLGMRVQMAATFDITVNDIEIIL